MVELIGKKKQMMEQCFFLSGHKEEDISMLSDGKWCVDLTEKYTDKLYLYGIPVYATKCNSCGFLAIHSTFP